MQRRKMDGHAVARAVHGKLVALRIPKDAYDDLIAGILQTMTMVLGVIFLVSSLGIGKMSFIGALLVGISVFIGRYFK